MPTYRYQSGDRPLDGYTIEHAIGRGGFGEVYFAVSDAGREVALKAVQNYEDIELRGISHCMNLKSPHLVMIFDVKHGDDGTPWVIMEYVSGKSLRQILDESPNGLGPEQATFFIRELAKGIDYLHDSGVVHRDLKPHNVFFEDGIVKIGDYSLSKVITLSHASGHTMTVGSVHYMAPEVSMGRYDKTVDLYALGVMLYEMLTGTPPFVGESVGEVLMKHLNSDVDVSDLPSPFAEAVRKSMSRDPKQRYQSAREFAKALGAGVGQSLDHSVPISLSLIGKANTDVSKQPLRHGDQEIADTVAKVTATSDTAESNPSRSQQTNSGSLPRAEHVGANRWESATGFAGRVLLSILVTPLLIYVPTFAQGFLPPPQFLPLCVLSAMIWGVSLLLVVIINRFAPTERAFHPTGVSKFMIVAPLALIYGFLIRFDPDDTVYSMMKLSVLSIGVTAIVIDFREFARRDREQRILTNRVLAAGVIGGFVLGIPIAIGTAAGFVSYAAVCCAVAAINIGLLSPWDGPQGSSNNSIRRHGKRPGLSVDSSVSQDQDVDRRSLESVSDSIVSHPSEYVA